MAQTQYLALLRGINVGGKNIIKMTDLKACFEELGFSNVATFIQSGNVVFHSTERGADKITHKIEAALTTRFHYPARLVTISHKDLQSVLDEAPNGFGTKPDTYRYDVIFIKKPLTAKKAMQQIRLREGVDQADAGKHALYFWRLTSKATQSYLPKIIALPIYQDMTIRNWNTTTKLLALMDKRSQDEK